MTIQDPRLRLVGLARYVAASGRVECDLFGELPDRLLDAEMLQDLWRERIQPVVEALKSEGLAVYVGRDGGFRAPEGYEHLPYVYAGDLAEDVRRRRAKALRAAEAAAPVLAPEDLATDDAPARLMPVFEAQRAAAAAPLVTITTVLPSATRRWASTMAHERG